MRLTVASRNTAYWLTLEEAQLLRAQMQQVVGVAEREMIAERTREATPQHGS